MSKASSKTAMITTPERQSIYYRLATWNGRQLGEDRRNPLAHLHPTAFSLNVSFHKWDMLRLEGTVIKGV